MRGKSNQPRRVFSFCSETSRAVMNFAVGSSGSSPAASNLFCANEMNTSGLLTVNASRNTSTLRRSYCTRAVPTGPGLAPMMATALPPNGGSGGRDIQSSVFFSTPGMEKLYSGVTIRMPSAALILAFSAVTDAGSPAARTSSLYSGMSAMLAISISMPAGASFWAAFSARVLYEAARRLPEMARTFIQGLLGSGIREGGMLFGADAHGTDQRRPAIDVALDHGARGVAGELQRLAAALGQRLGQVGRGHHLGEGLAQAGQHLGRRLRGREQAEPRFELE